MFDPIAVSNDDDSIGADGEAICTILFGIDADSSSGRNGDSFVDDCVAYVGSTTNVDAFVDNRTFDMGIAIDANVRAQNAMLHQAT